MSISREIERLNTKTVKETAASIIEANITGIGNSDDKYEIKLRNGGIISNVLGGAGYSVGQSVVVAVYPGKAKKYVIVGPGYRNTGTITEVWV